MTNVVQGVQAQPKSPCQPTGEAVRVTQAPGAFTMFRGGTLPAVQIAYECWGALNAARDNCILLFTGLSASSHARSGPADPQPGWWEDMIGPGAALDTTRYFVVCVNSLGSCFGSTGPACTDPRAGRAYGLNFPELSIEDIARGAQLVVEDLGIARLAAVVGASLGGMAALSYAMLYPSAVRDLVSISAATRSSPFAIALRSLQREMIRKDPLWRQGVYDAEAPPHDGMVLARKLGLLSYRSAQEWSVRFGRQRIPEAPTWREPFDLEFQVEAYLDHNARKFARRFDANAYLYLSRAMDWFDVAQHGGSLARGLAKIEAQRTLVLGVESDILFPVQQQAEIAQGLLDQGRDVRYVALDSPYGHDAFLVDKARFAPVLKEFFATPSA